MYFLRLLCILPFLSVPVILFSQSGKPSFAKEPLWIAKNNIDYNKTSLDKDAAEGSIDISYETQVSLDERSKYTRRIKKIISQAGVQNGSMISVTFNPSYEQLIFHCIQIIRKGEIINKLQLSKIKTVHQEEELSGFIYNGSLNAVLILEDVRKGDIIEYSYNITGFNPVFKNKYAGEFDMGYAVPIYELFYRLIVPKGRTVDIKNFNETIKPVVTDLNGQRVYEWRKSNVPPLLLQNRIPSWYDPYARVSVSEYKSWKEVNDWAMELFPANKILSAGLQKKIAEIKKTYPDDATRIMASLRFVQDDIRYMGIEMGVNSHKPADPSKVYAQRFGDCKEKSYLLCCILNAMNIEASPVLINTTVKKNLNNLLPSATDFNHVTVRVKLDTTYYWFDPTIAYQRGNIKELFYPDYQEGLVISEATSSLTSISFRSISYQHIDEYFKVHSMTGSGTLIVTTNFKGDEADATREHFNNVSIAEIMTSNKKFYAKYYEDIASDSLTYTDNDSTGIFTTIEYYTIPNFWTTGKGSVKKFLFTAFAINEILNRPKEKGSKMPFGLMFPARYREEVTIVLPEEWNVTASESHLKNDGFAYNSKFYCVYNQIHLTTDYENYKDFVTTDEFPDYFRSVKQYDDKENYSISAGDDYDTAKNSGASNKDILSIVIFVVIIGGGMLWWNRRK
jgi:Domain of Unknown Function with PDB structure (DUF3857)